MDGMGCGEGRKPAHAVTLASRRRTCPQKGWKINGPEVPEAMNSRLRDALLFAIKLVSIAALGGIFGKALGSTPGGVIGAIGATLGAEIRNPGLATLWGFPGSFIGVAILLHSGKYPTTYLLALAVTFVSGFAAAWVEFYLRARLSVRS